MSANCLANSLQTDGPACLACLPATSARLPGNPNCTFGLSNDSCYCGGSGATNEASRPTAAV